MFNLPVLIGSFPHPPQGAGGAGPAGPPGTPGVDGDGSLAKVQGLQTIADNTLTSLTGFTLVASSTYLDVTVSSLTTGKQAWCSFETNGSAAIIAATFQVYLGCNLQDPDDAVNFSSIFPGMGINAGAVAFKHLSGAPMNIRWVARRGAPA